jgi:hypothetical protein
VEFDGGHAQDVELLLPGGECLFCALAGRHIQRMGATVRVVAGEPWVNAVAATRSSRPPPRPGEWLEPGKIDLRDCDDVEVDAESTDHPSTLPSPPPDCEPAPEFKLPTMPVPDWLAKRLDGAVGPDGYWMLVPRGDEQNGGDHGP